MNIPIEKIRNKFVLFIMVILLMNCSSIRDYQQIKQNNIEQTKKFKIFFLNLEFNGFIYNKFKRNGDYFCVIKIHYYNDEKSRSRVPIIENNINSKNISNYYMNSFYHFYNLESSNIVKADTLKNVKIELILNNKIYNISKVNDLIIKKENKNELYINDTKFDYMLDTNESDWLFEN